MNWQVHYIQTLECYEKLRYCINSKTRAFLFVNMICIHVESRLPLKTVLMKVMSLKGINHIIEIITQYTTYLTINFISRLEKELLQVEKKYKLAHRWSPSDKVFADYQQVLADSKRKQILSSLWITSTKRQYLLKLKAKYAGNS